MPDFVQQHVGEELPARHRHGAEADRVERQRLVGIRIGQLRDVVTKVGPYEIGVFEEPCPIAKRYARALWWCGAFQPAEMPALNEEHMIEQIRGRGEAAARLEDDRHPSRIRGNPFTPLRSFVIRVVEEPLDVDGHAHDPRASSTVSTRTGPSSRPRTPASMALRSPAMTTAKRPGWM